VQLCSASPPRGRLESYQGKDWGVADIWEKTVARFPNRPSIVFEGKTLTFKQVDEQTNRLVRAEGPRRTAHVRRLGSPARLGLAWRGGRRHGALPGQLPEEQGHQARRCVARVRPRPAGRHHDVADLPRWRWHLTAGA